MNANTLAVCRKCGNEQALSAFPFRKEHNSYRTTCKSCAYAVVKLWRDTHQCRVKELMARYVGKYQEKYKEYRTGWRKRHPEKLNEQRKSYYSRHKDKFAAKSVNRRARKRKAGGRITEKDIGALMVLQRGLCAVCKTSLRPRFHRDHIVPLAAGGSNDRLNIQLLCPECNLAKGKLDPIDFMRSLGRLI